MNILATFISINGGFFIAHALISALNTTMENSSLIGGLMLVGVGCIIHQLDDIKKKLTPPDKKLEE